MEEAYLLSVEQNLLEVTRNLMAHPTGKEIAMNKDQVKGKAKEVGGKVQQKVGEAVGSRQQQAEGLSNQAEGKVQKKVGDVKEIAKGNR